MTGIDTVGDESDVRSWLVLQGLAGADISDLLAGFCLRLRALGMPLGRGHLSTATLDAQMRSFSLTWSPQSGITRPTAHPHDPQPPQRWRESPLFYLLSNKMGELHCRLVPVTEPDFPVFDEFRAAGLTDYYASVFGYGWVAENLETQGVRELGMICSWASDAPGGFGASLAQIKDLLPTFALAVKATLSGQITRNVLATYLGPDVAARVLSGEIRRGTARALTAAIFFADLRGFTRLADTIPSPELVAILNRYFDSVVRPVEAHGGQVLKFLGDGLLATFALNGRDEAAVCDAAAAAALQALDNVRALSEEQQSLGKPFMALDIALHFGEVMYGNVGSHKRLDFTVIGPAVNEAARMESLCGGLDVNLVLSEVFYGRLKQYKHNAQALGEHRLRGVRDAKALHTLCAAGIPKDV